MDVFGVAIPNWLALTEAWVGRSTAVGAAAPYGSAWPARTASQPQGSGLLVAAGVGLVPLVTEVAAEAGTVLEKMTTVAVPIMPEKMTAATAAMLSLALRPRVRMLISLETPHLTRACVPHSLTLNVLGVAIGELSVGECLSIASSEKMKM